MSMDDFYGQQIKIVVCESDKAFLIEGKLISEGSGENEPYGIFVMVENTMQFYPYFNIIQISFIGDETSEEE